MKIPINVIIIIGLVLFSIYRRVRRNIGWQELQSNGLRIWSAIYFTIGLIFLCLSGLHPISLLSDTFGILAGVGIAYYGAAMTRFEQRAGRLYYCPNTWIGSFVVAIFLGRLVFRFYEVFSLVTPSELHSGFAAGGMQSIGFSLNGSWTSGLLLIMFAYNITYNILLVGKQRRLSMQG